MITFIQCKNNLKFEKFTNTFKTSALSPNICTINWFTLNLYGHC